MRLVLSFDAWNFSNDNVIEKGAVAMIDMSYFGLKNLSSCYNTGVILSIIKQRNRKQDQETITQLLICYFT